MKFEPDIFGKISFSGEAVADLLFFLAATLTTVITVILFYHWQKYTLKGKFMATMELLYLGVAAVLLATMFFSLFILN